MNKAILFASLLLAPLAAVYGADAHAIRSSNVKPQTLPEGVRRVGPSELRIEREYIAPPNLERPTPQGLVDANPPWLHVQVPLPSDKQGVRAQKWNRRFYFKLSQDPELKKGVIESGPKRWSFYNPFRTLSSGTWYWTYGVAPAESPEKPVWVKEVFTFEIDGHAFTPPLPPTAEEALAAIKKHKSGPVAICTREDIGHILPEKHWPELAEQMKEDARKALKNGERPVEIEISDKDYPTYMGKNPKEVYFTIKMRAMFTVEERRVDALLRGYLVTGDEQYKKLGVQRAIELEQLRLNKCYSILGKQIPMSRPAFYNTVPLLMLDAFYEDMPAQQQQTFVELALSLMDKHNNGHPHLHDQLEHAHFNQHDWQGDIKNLMVGSAILCRYRPELDDWFKYAYELWLYRSPALSRNDGGSMDGNGYLGVHDEPLTHISWMLYRLTGYNYFNYKQWFANFPVYMSYMNAAGNPGVPYSDGGDGSPGVPYLTEMLAYMCPQNPANLWRFKSQGRREANEFSKDMVKGYKAMDMLLLWQHFQPPDLTKAKPPSEAAAVFRDVGMAAMHSDILEPSHNLMVNFSSAVNGSFQHLHPAQNAFCVAYGGEPLFWRTGYYNGGQLHDAVSYKASRAHNTIMVDGLMQGFDLGAYGWIPRFATGKRISYVMGDASHAYNGMFPKYGISDPSKPLEPGFTKLGVPITRENGFGKPGVTRFRRHLVMLRPSHILIYDELEEEKPVTWSFMLHSLQPIHQLGNVWFQGANEKARASARLFCKEPVSGHVTDQFFGVPVDEENKRGGQNPPNWHVSISTSNKLAATRFLMVIEVMPGKDSKINPIESVAQGGGRIKLELGDYIVSAQLDASQPACLEARSRDDRCVLVSSQPTRSIALGGDSHPVTCEGSTILWEKSTETGGDIFVEAIDQLPDVLLYGNRY
jgi:hypothetical protein